MKSKILFIIVVILSIVACGTTYIAFNAHNGGYDSNKPDDVSQEFWDRTIQYTLYIDKFTKEYKDLPDNLASELNDIAKNKAELEIALDIHVLCIASLTHLTNGDVGYEKEYSKLEDIFGKDLKKAKLDIALVESYIESNTASTLKIVKYNDDEVSPQMKEAINTLIYNTNEYVVLMKNQNFILLPKDPSKAEILEQIDEYKIIIDSTSTNGITEADKEIHDDLYNYKNNILKCMAFMTLYIQTGDAGYLERHKKYSKDLKVSFKEIKELGNKYDLDLN